MIEEFFKRIAAEASSRELGLLSVLLGLGYVLGSVIAGVAWLPAGLQAIGPVAWDLVFTSVIYGGYRMIGSTRASNAETVAALKRDELARKALELEVERTLHEFAVDAEAYKGRARPSATEGFDFEYEKLSSRSARHATGYQPDQLLMKIRADLLSVYDFYRAEQLDAVELGAARRKAISDNLKVRSGFGLPHTKRLLALDQRLEKGVSQGGTRLDDHL